jgi:CRISPR/Cas system Type II protein with McrA/HNH and RuvC-like nuclease domain
MSNEMTLWKKTFGNETEATDFAGRLMRKSEYGNEESLYGWNIDHICPKANGGKDSDDNKQIVNIKTNVEKGDDFPQFEANGKRFQVKKQKNYNEQQDKVANYDPKKKYVITEISR